MASIAKKVGFWFCMALIIGNMIGSGIFLLPANLARYGGISILGWLVTIAGVMCLASVFADLSKKFPRAGGPYAFTYEGFGDFAAFWIAWGYWISLWSGVAAIAIAFTGALSVFFPILKEDMFYASITSITCIALLTAINLMEIKKIGGVVLLTTILKLIPIVALGVIGIFYFEPSHFEPFNVSNESSISAITATATLTLWAFLSFESATIISHKVENARVTVPKATFYGTLFVALLYLVSSTVVMGIIPMEQLQSSTAPFADAAIHLWGDWAGYLIAGGIAISCFGAMNGLILLQAQIPFSAAQDGLFPQVFKRESANGSPYFGVIFSSCLAIIILIINNSSDLVKQFEILILLSTLTSLVPFTFSTMTHFKELLHLKNQLTLFSFYKKLGITIGAFLFSFLAIVGSGSQTVYFGFLLLLAGLPIYIMMKKPDEK